MIVGNSFLAEAQRISPDSVLSASRLFAQTHAAQIRHIKFDVQIMEKNRFTSFPSLAQKRLERIEGIRAHQWYGKLTNESVYLGAMNQMIHEIKLTQGFHNQQVQPSLFFWPDFYQDYLGGMCVSPLNYHADSYYRFDFLGIIQVDHQVAYQFRVIPDYNTDRLFNGTIVLSEDGWLIQFSGQVESDAIMYEINLQNQFVHDRWLPKQLNFSVSGGLLGIKGVYEIQEEVKSPLLTWEPSLHDFTKPEKKNEILNISARAFDEVYVSQLLANLQHGIARKWKQRAHSDLISIDSVLIRKEPSQGVDLPKLAFFAELDTSNSEPASANYDALAISPLRLDHFVFSHSFYFGKRRTNYYPYEIYYKSPVFDSNYNTVEGFVSNAALVFRKRWAQYRFLETELLGRRSFGTNRNTGYYKLKYVTEKLELGISSGDYIAQYNPENPISPEMNSLSSLLLKNNVMKIYRKQFVNFNAIKRISSAFYYKLFAEYSYRSQLINTDGYYWINYLNRNFSDNNPTNEEYKTVGFRSHYSMVTQVNLIFRPFLSQSYQNGYRNSDWGSSPLIQVKYRAGWPNFLQSSTDFQHLEISYMQNTNLSPWVKSGFLINAGTFFGKFPAYFMDYKHFNGGMNFVQTGDMLASHRLIGYYQNFTTGANQRLNVNHYAYSTAGNYVEALSQFQFTNLWLKPLLGTKKAYIKELLIANAVYLPRQNLFYQEIGYGLDGVIKVLRLEAIANFTNGSFNYVGFRLNINSRIRIGNIPE